MFFIEKIMFNSHAVMHSVVSDNSLHGSGSGSGSGSGHTEHTHAHSHYHSHVATATSQQPLPNPSELPTHDIQKSPSFQADNIQPVTTTTTPTTTSHIDSATSLSGGGNVENTHHGFEPLTILAQEVY